MNLESLVIKRKETDVEVPGYDGLVLTIQHLSKSELQKLRKRCINNKFSRSSRQMTEEVDTDMFQRLYIEQVLVGWKGLKYRYLAKMFPVDLSSVSEDDELEYSKENAFVLMTNADDIDAFVTDTLEDIQNFVEKKAKK